MRERFHDLFEVMQQLVLISFEIMLYFAQISRFKFTDRLLYYTANPSALVPTTLLFFEFCTFIEVLLQFVVFSYLGP